MIDQENIKNIDEIPIRLQRWREGYISGGYAAIILVFAITAVFVQLVEMKQAFTIGSAK